MQSTSKKSIEYNFVESDRINSVNIDNYNTAIIIGSGDKTFQQTIKEYTVNGGSIIFFPEGEASLDDENKLLTTLGLPKYSGLFQNKDNLEINSFDKIDFEHPIFDELFNQNDKEIESPNIYKYLKINTEGKGRSIISLKDNSAFLSEYRIGKGDVFLFDISPNIEWSNFPLKNIFAPLINRAVSYLVTNHSQKTSYTTGEAISVNISKRKSNQIKVIKPDNTEEIVNTVAENNNFINYESTNLPGIYKFYSNNSLIDIQKVNYNNLESNLESLTSNERNEKFKKNSNEVTEIKADDNYKTKILSARYGSELWQLFLVIAIILALLEMFLARSSKKDIAEL